MFLVASEALLASRAHTDAAGAAVARIAVCLPIYLALSYWMRFCVDPSFTGPFMAPVAAGLRWVLRRVGGHRLGEKMAGDTTKVVILLALRCLRSRYTTSMAGSCKHGRGDCERNLHLPAHPQRVLLAPLPRHARRHALLVCVRRQCQWESVYQYRFPGLPRAVRGIRRWNRGAWGGGRTVACRASCAPLSDPQSRHRHPPSLAPQMSRILVASREAVIENIVPKEVGQALIQSRISARHVDGDCRTDCLDNMVGASELATRKHPTRRHNTSPRTLPAADDWRRAPTGRASTSMETRTARKSLDARDVDLAAEASSPRARMWRKGPSSRVGPSRASEDTHASAANVLANRRIATPARAATTRTAQALLGEAQWGAQARSSGAQRRVHDAAAAHGSAGPGHGEAATTPGTPQPPPVQLRLVTPPFQASEAHAADGPPQQGVWKNILAPVMRRTACEDPVSPSAGMRQRRPSPLVLPAPDLSDMSRPRTPLGIQSTALDGMQGGAVVLPYYRDFEDVGMLFSDVVGFTSMSAQLPPKRILLLLHQCFSAIDKCVRHLGAFKARPRACRGTCLLLRLAWPPSHAALPALSHSTRLWAMRTWQPPTSSERTPRTP